MREAPSGPMDRRDLDEIERFLTSVGRPTLFAYYALEPTTEPLAAEEAIKKRRTWAQGQQSNPKYKSEALFLIKNNALLKRVLVEHLEEYRVHVRDDTQHRNLDVLTLFIRGTIASGELTPQAEAAILHQGRQLELSDAAVARRVQELLTETGAVRVGFESEDLSTEAMAIDHYAILGVATNAAPGAIEEGYRNRYRWARNLKDLKRSAEVLQALDQAWRILSDPTRRARYDERRLQMLEVTDEVEKRAAALMGLLGGPEDAITGEAPLPGAPPAPVHEVGFRAGTVPPGTRLPAGDPRLTAPPGTRLPNAEARGAPPLPVPPPEPPPIRLAPREDPHLRAPNGRAPAPPPVPGRTIGLAAGPQAVATLGPRLGVDGPDVISVQVGSRPVARRWTIRNTGQGKMPGRVTSDREWLRVEQARLDPVAPNQIVTVTILPQQMPWGRTAGTVTVVTDHGERRTMTVQVHRRSWLPLAAGVAALGVLGFLAVAGLLYLRSRGSDTVLALAVDPIADRVLVDGQDAGRGRLVEVREPRPGQPFQLRVEADGFEPLEEVVALRPGERTARTVTLALADDMAWMPGAGAKGVDAPAEVRSAVEAAAPGLGTCFVGAAVETAEATYTAWVTPDGQVRRVDVTEANFPVEPAQPCIRRVFRALRLPTFAGDHAAVEARLSVPVPR